MCSVCMRMCYVFVYVCMCGVGGERDVGMQLVFKCVCFVCMCGKGCEYAVSVLHVCVCACVYVVCV